MEPKQSKCLLRTLFLLFAVYAACTTVLFTGIDSASAHPVKDPATDGYTEQPYYSIRNKLTIPQIQSCITNGGSGLVFDMTAAGCNITTLQDGTTIDPSKIYGTVFIGPYPFEESEVNYTYKRFRRNSSISAGKGKLDVPYLLAKGHNSEDWTDEGQVVVRLSLKVESAGKDVTIGDYDTIVRFKKIGSTYVKLPSITEGPLVNMITSDNTGEIVLSFKTSDAVQPKVVLTNGGMTKEFTGISGTKHEIALSGLVPSTEYWYYVEYNDAYSTYQTKIYPFKSAPEAGKGSVKFAVTGDSREGEGGGNYNFMGTNFATLERLANLAYQIDVDLLLEAGDLFNGYTSRPDDFRTQFHAWKQALSGLWSQKPVYAGMGNHESLLKAYTKAGSPSVQLDRWPYETESAEAVFADELVQPLNGPADPSDGRPTYKENVYSFQYGPVKFISFNNNYWAVFGADSSVFGGSPEGYVMTDQLAWIDQELKKAEEDATVKYVVLFAHEPIVPNGGHVEDSMWYFGNNNVKAYTFNPLTGNVEAAGNGIVDVRNELVKMLSNYKKVATVVGAHEHSHQKTLVNKDVPLGDPAKDDANGNNTVCEAGESCSTLSLKYPTWYLVAGDAGAPHYSEEETPWNSYWKGNPSACVKQTTSSSCYYYSSQENIYIFEADSDRLSLTVYNPYGKVIDNIEDLMAVKNRN